MRTAESADLSKIAASAADGEGVIWTLETSGDLNANLVSFGAGRGVGEHVNDEVDIVILGVSGSGVVVVGKNEHPLQSGTLVFVPKGVRRSIRGGSGGFGYLTVHRRRGPIRLDNNRRLRRGEGEDETTP